MRSILLVGMGSFIGGAARFLVQLWAQGRWGLAFPWGTLSVNITGCFLIGLIFAYSLKGQVSQDWRLFLVTGICGGYTTFSAFSMETITLLRTGEWLSAGGYISASVILGLLSTFAGILLVRFI